MDRFRQGHRALSSGFQSAQGRSKQGDGQAYKSGLRTDDAFDSAQYQARFATRAGEWLEVVLPITGFQPTFRGRHPR